MTVVGMEEQNVNEEEVDTKAGGAEDRAEENHKMMGLTRKEKRKAMKKMKRKQIRKELAEKEREDENARLNDPEELARLKAAEEEEARRRDRELKEFEERERAWMEAMELKKKLEEEEEQREEEEKRRRGLEEPAGKQVYEEDECKEDDEWEYVEEGPPEIIFEGNEIILRKKKVRIPKKQANQQRVEDDADRPTSNPLPPQSEAFADYHSASSAQQALENVAQQVPNFGTEQDKAHCPFHLKTGACRFGQRCSRVHFYPDKSCTLLMKNMYNGPGLTWEQDEGLEVCKRCPLVILYGDEEVERCYEEFYDDVHTEFLKFGELLNFKVCKNGSFHLRGNVYVHYKSLESSVLAYQSINGRYFAGKQVKCEFVNVTKWKVAICGEYMKSRLKTCSRGTACNFIHCFRNPGGDYEWADWDKRPPRYWVKNMASLFGYSDEHEKQIEHEYLSKPRDSGKVISADPHRELYRRSSRSRDPYHLDNRSGSSHRKHSNYGSDVRERAYEDRHSRYKSYGHDEGRSHSSYSDEYCSDMDMKEVREDIHESPYYAKKTSKRESKWSKRSPEHGVIKKRHQENYSDDDSLDRDKDREICSGHERERIFDYVRKASRDRGPPLDKDKERKTCDDYIPGSSKQHIREGSVADHVEGNKNHGDDSTPEKSEIGKDKHGHHRHKRKNSWDHENASGTPVYHGKSRRIKCDDADGDKSRNHCQKSSSCNDIDEESPDDHWKLKQMDHHTDRGNKKQDRETDFLAGRLDGDEEGKCHYPHRRKEKISESPDDGGNFKKRNLDSYSSEEISDRKRHKKRHHTHKRKHSRNDYKVPESPDNHHKTHVSDSRDDILDSDREAPNQESKSIKGNKSRQESWVDDDDVSCHSGEYIDKLGRWKPEGPEY